ncbi:cupin domain-containing protein [Actinokineospora auranticolor]|uniref:DUF985 domain-containing protein n=1 Tax=Actinokineospora auranticolor TaxID=155976 RepID=A0A2S6GQI7_9PSEU|nr:cupin domain-containing protein [Actinokineospora auranticolor]PPK67381.1 hypothetical protein CLV40_10744 [Actinokineospora auranticolor]
MTEAREVVELLGLSPLPLAGQYFTDSWVGESFSAIYYLLAAPAYSSWHRVDRDELYVHHAGAALTVHLLDPVGYRAVRLGPDLRAGERPQLVIPSGAWRASETGSWSLIGTVVVPPFAGAVVEPGTAELVRDQPDLARLLRTP